jgi:hypothetical protein
MAGETVWSRIRRWFCGPSAEEILAEFAQRFPGRCPICSFARFQMNNPPEHGRCPERRAE